MVCCAARVMLKRAMVMLPEKLILYCTSSSSVTRSERKDKPTTEHKPKIISKRNRALAKMMPVSPLRMMATTERENLPPAMSGNLTVSLHHRPSPRDCRLGGGQTLRQLLQQSLLRRQARRHLHERLSPLAACAPRRTVQVTGRSGGPSRCDGRRCCHTGNGGGVLCGTRTDGIHTRFYLPPRGAGYRTRRQRWPHQQGI